MKSIYSTTTIDWKREFQVISHFNDKIRGNKLLEPQNKPLLQKIDENYFTITEDPHVNPYSKYYCVSWCFFESGQRSKPIIIYMIVYSK